MKINMCTKSDQYKKISLQLIFSIGTMKININKKLSDLIDYNQYPMLRVACCYRSCFLSFLGNITSRGHFGSNWEHLNKKLNRWLKRNEHEPGGSDSIQMHNMHINLIAHSQVKTWNPTPECPNQIYPYVEVFHSLFTSFSRPFHEFFTVFSHFWVLRCSCVFLRQFQRKP